MYIWLVRGGHCPAPTPSNYLTDADDVRIAITIAYHSAAIADGTNEQEPGKMWCRHRRTADGIIATGQPCGPDANTWFSKIDRRVTEVRE